MKAPEVMERLRAAGSEPIRKILVRHGAREPLFGVKVEDLKRIRRAAGGGNPLALELFATGNYDAMYLAGLIADGSVMTTGEIRRWAEAEYGGAISEYTVPWVAAENAAACDLALEWIDSDRECLAVTGWATLSSVVSVWPDDRLDIPRLDQLLQRIEREIHQAPNRVRYVMNEFVIAAGSFVPALYDRSLTVAGKIGKVQVDMQGTACKVPLAAEYIVKVSKLGRTGHKRKTAKC